MIRRWWWNIKGLFQDMNNGYSYEDDKRYFTDGNGERKLDENYHRP